MEGISATVITLNEEANIERCLNSLIGLADEIIVVDSGSTDNTVEICKRYGCQVITRPFAGYGLQRQYATSLTKHNYVLALDADEALDEQLHNAIKEIKAKGFEHRVYAMHSQTYTLGHPVHITHRVSRPIRLFNKRYAQWNLEDVDEKIAFPGALKPEVLPGTILHYRCNSLKEMYKKEMHLSRLFAAKHVALNGVPSLPQIWYKTAKLYMSVLLAERNILDGAIGRQIAKAKASTLYRALREIRANQ